MMQSDQCITCKHYRGSHACVAFPDRIPQIIFEGTFDHLNAFDGDNGIRWDEFDVNEIPDSDAQETA